jgi:putative multiple sugar transport system permease protein
VNQLAIYFKKNIRQNGMFLALIATMVLFQITTDGILFRPLNVNNLVLQNSYILVLAIGMLPVILTGRIDLSVGSVVAFVGAVSAVMMVDWDVPVWLAIVGALFLGAAVGALHGYLIAYLKIPMFITTLAGMLFWRGLTMVILQGQTKAPFATSFQAIAAGYLPGREVEVAGLNVVAIIFGFVLTAVFTFLILRSRKDKIKYGFEVTPRWIEGIRLVFMMVAVNFLTFSLAGWNGIPIVFVLLLGLVTFYTFLTQNTILGRHIYALGGNANAARLSGVKTDRVLFLVYMNNGIMAALAGLVVMGRLNAATPKAGTSFELDAIAACFIGGASARGGVGTIVGAVIGGLFIGVLNNGMSIMGVSVDWQQAIKGVVLLIAVYFDVVNKNRESIA